MTFPIEMPARLVPAVVGRRWERVTEGRSGGMIYRLEPDQTVAAIGRFARLFHTLPVDECPFNAEHPLHLDEARRNLDAGRVDASDFDEEHSGWVPHLPSRTVPTIAGAAMSATVPPETGVHMGNVGQCNRGHSDRVLNLLTRSVAAGAPLCGQHHRRSP